MKSTKSILIVDDDDDIRNVLAEFLLRKGFEIAIAKNGREGLQIFTDKTFDLVLTDFQMPYMNGLILASEIKKKQPKTIIVIMSGNVQMTRQTKGVADHILAKPFRIKEIYNLVNSVLESTDPEQRGMPAIGGSVAVAMC